MQIYFAGAISGGRQNLEDYQMVSKELLSWGSVLPEAVSDQSVGSSGEDRLAGEVFRDETEQIRSCDAFVLEASSPSFGVGFQTAQALSFDKPVLALYRRGNPLSAILVGAAVRYEAYSTKHDLQETLRIFFEEIS